MAVALILALVAAGAGLLAASARRRRLNEGLHELRRPLQILALRYEGDPQAREWLRQARHAMRELDRSINGGPSALREGQGVELAQLLDRARARWSLSGIDFGPDQPGSVAGDPAQLAVALDNLIANAVEHGDGRVRVSVSQTGGAAQVQVANRADGPLGPRPAGRSPRRGLGLRIAARAATDCGGELERPKRIGEQTVAEITLPSLPSSAASAASR